MDLSLIIAVALALTVGQTPPPLTITAARQLYDAGKYQEVVAEVDARAVDTSRARLQYLAAQSYDKLKNSAAARRSYERLVESGGETAWSAIGKSAIQVMDQKLDAALTSANDAVRLGASVPESHYQRGIVLMTKKDYPAAAEAFAKSTQLDPAYGSAFYYAGLAYYRAGRIDLMTNNFEKFVKLAPNAPERPEVESILRTVRGKQP